MRSPLQNILKAHPARLIPGRGHDSDAPFRALRKVLEDYLDEEAIADVARAYNFSEQAHAGQHRKSGEPYIHHPLAVARILADMHMDGSSIVAAILHDVTEDTGTAGEIVAAEFGREVAMLVDGVSKIDKIQFGTPEAAEAESFRKMLLAMSRDLRVILIKLADRLHNMRTLGSLPRRKRLRIAHQTQEIYAPIANRLGLRRWSQELEDLSFHHTYTYRYQTIARALRRRKGHRVAAMKKVVGLFEEQLQAGGVPARVDGREKNIYSIYRKMQRKRLHLRDLRDVYGLRVIVQNTDDCYRALGVIHARHKPIPNCFKDYIAVPKVNGYQSLHTTVFDAFGETVEVQIRTEQMHRNAEAGIAAHWLYKSTGKHGTESQQPARQWLLDLLETQQSTGNPGEFLEHLKVDLFPDEVYVFTPCGDVKKLPGGATALDFAYAVHSGIGNRCTGIKVGGQRVPLYTVLKSGSHVEVLTTRGARPSPLWLDFVVTGKARAAIRSALKNQRHKDAVKLGRRLLDRALRSLKNVRPRITAETKAVLLQLLEIGEWDELLADIGHGRRLPMVVARQMLPDRTEDGSPALAPTQSMAIRGAEGMLMTYARCCRPVPGDTIRGALTSGKGIVVHVWDCPNAIALAKHPEKLIPMHWDENVRGDFGVNLRLETENKPGVLASLATIIADLHSNITSASVQERDGRYSTARLTIEVQDRSHLARILRKLRREPSLLRVNRVKG